MYLTFDNETGPLELMLRAMKAVSYGDGGFARDSIRLLQAYIASVQDQCSYSVPMTLTHQPPPGGELYGGPAPLSKERTLHTLNILT